MAEKKSTEPIALETHRARRARCVHHWVLQDPSSGWVRGACRNCGAKKRFPAQPESTSRFDDYRELTAASAYVERLSA